MIGRIRTVKPEMFTHELLWMIEQSTGLPMIRSYIALWCLTDRDALFEWKPRVLKTHCAPYDAIDFEDVLNALANCGFVVKYVHAGRLYGWIPRFLNHQNINGRESESRLPAPPNEVRAEHESRMLQTDFHMHIDDKEWLLGDAPILGAGEVYRDTMPASWPAYARPESGYVYYARDGEIVKIGHSKNPWARIAELRTSRPALAIVAVEKGGASLEAQRHEQFKSAHVNREWFTWSAEFEQHCFELRSRYDDDIRSMLKEQSTNDLASRGAHVVAPVTDSSQHAPPPEQNRTEQNRTERSNSIVEPNSSTTSTSAVARELHEQQGSTDVVAVVESAPATSLQSKAAALPAIKGKRTAAAILERLSSVMAEVSEGTRRRVSGAQMRELQAQFVFTYWANVHGHLQTLMDEKRVRRVIARLEENGGDVSELLYVVDGAKRDKHLMGENDRSTVYDGIETLFRDRAMVERLAEKMPKFKQKVAHPMMAKWASVISNDDDTGAQTST